MGFYKNTVLICATLADLFYSEKHRELYAYIKRTLILVYKVQIYFKMFIINFDNYKKQETYTLSKSKVLYADTIIKYSLLKISVQRILT